jgi:hypothetical protein
MDTGTCDHAKPVNPARRGNEYAMSTATQLLSELLALLGMHTAVTFADLQHHSQRSI